MDVNQAISFKIWNKNGYNVETKTQILKIPILYPYFICDQKNFRFLAIKCKSCRHKEPFVNSIS